MAPRGDRREGTFPPVPIAPPLDVPAGKSALGGRPSGRSAPGPRPASPRTGALGSLTREEEWDAAAATYAPKSLRVNAVAPGPRADGGLATLRSRG